MSTKPFVSLHATILAGMLAASTYTCCATDALFEGMDPLGWAQEPHARVSHAATMAAAPVTAPGGVEYQFTCTAGGATSIAWQTNPVCEVTGLKPEADYTFVATVRARDTKAELRAPSRPVAVRTPKADRFDAAMDRMELVPLMVNGDKDNRINIVIASRWERWEKEPYHTPAMRATFLKDAQDVVDKMFAPRGLPDACEPFSSQRAFFNVYALWWPDAPPWNPVAYNTHRAEAHRTEHDLDDTAADRPTYYAVRARQFLPWQIEGKGWVTYMCMRNSRSGGGDACRNDEGRIGDAVITGNDLLKFYHEFSHTAMALGDKYVAAGLWGYADESMNTTLVFQRDKVKWKAWIDPETPVPTPYARKCLWANGLFEGSLQRFAYVFCATPICGMGVNQFATRVCDTCTQSAALRTYKWVDPFENPNPARSQLTLKSPGRARFSVSRVKPLPDTQQVEWRVNGKVVASGCDAIDVDLGALDAYDIVCAMVDRTRLVREDPPYASFPRAAYAWHVVNPHPTSTAPPLGVALQPRQPDCWGAHDGAISVTVTGGTPPYAFIWSNGMATTDISGLDEGTYALRVVDGEFRHAETACTLTRQETVTVDPRSTLRDGRWDVKLAVHGCDASALACSWSSGATGLVLTGVTDGAYRYTVTHAGGASCGGEVSLHQPAALLEVAVTETIPSTGENNGGIRLAIRGGREPYSVLWADKPKRGGAERMFLAPGTYTATVKDANMTTVENVVKIGSEPVFMLERPRFVATPAGGVKIADPQKGMRYLWYGCDYPSYIMRPPRGVYEGTFTTKDGRVVEADGTVIPHTGGKWVNGPDVDTEKNRTKNNYGSWVRLDAYVNGRSAEPMTLRLNSDDKGKPHATIVIGGNKDNSPINATNKWNGTAENGRMIVRNEGTGGGAFDLYYTARHENPSRPLAVGTEFRPGAPGNYYIAAQREDTGARSWNRVGVAVTMGPEPPHIQPLKPNEAKSGKLLLWLDATDIDGDGAEDAQPFDRGALMGWRGKPGGIRPSCHVFYEPNVLNGMAVISWQRIWLQSLENEVKDFRTIIMVYRDHDLSRPGTGPWQGVPACIWDLSATNVPAIPRDTTAWLNGRRIDPCATPAPTNFCVASFAFAAPCRPMRDTETEWEGAIAEMVVFDRILSESERQGIEEYLRRKWLSAVNVTATVR